MDVEDVVLAKEMKGKRKRDEGTSSNREKKKKEKRCVGQATGKKKELPEMKPKFINFTPLIMQIDQVLMQIRDDPFLRCPKPISTPVERRDKNKHYKFH